MEEDEFLTIQQAMHLTGKSKSTIRRFVVELRNAGEHANTLLKVPTQNGQFYYTISKQKLTETYPMSIHDDTHDTPPTTTQDHIQTPTQPPIQSTTEGNLQAIEVLSEQLKRMDGELKRKDQFIAQVLERQRESHLLVKTLQDQLFLLQEPRKKTSKRVESEYQKEEPQEITLKEKPAKTRRTKTKGFWRSARETRI